MLGNNVKLQVPEGFQVIPQCTKCCDYRKSTPLLFFKQKVSEPSQGPSSVALVHKLAH